MSPGFAARLDRPMNDAQAADVPLFVDLDGTLIKTDLLLESYLALLKKNLWHGFIAPFWLIKGKAAFKRRVASGVEIDPALLPYHAPFVEYLRGQAAEGRKLYLATACDRKLAEPVADYLGIFSAVLASEGETNLSGVRKLQAMKAVCGERGFDYAGNAGVDVGVWSDARRALLVNAPNGVARAVRRVVPIERAFNERRGSLAACIRAMRIHQWLKNLLLFVPLVAAHAWTIGLEPLLLAVAAFVAFCLTASGVYIVNDLLDLQADRAHPSKRHRPVAAGDLSITRAIALALVLLCAGFLFAASISPLFLSMLVIYGVVSQLYSLRLKAIVIIDVVVLAGLYTLRLIAGAAAIDVTPSFWLLAFSMFVFFSLALAKRCAELHGKSSQDRVPASGRDYHAPDLGYLHSMGTASGYLAVLVLALFINSPDVYLNYLHPKALWLLCPILLYWISRLWLKTGRGEMNEDPVIYAVTDPGSRYVAGAIAVVFLLATY